MISTSPVAFGAQTNQHAFACTDYTQGQVFIVSGTGKVEWEYPASSCNDLWVLPNGNLLFNTRRSVREVSRDNRILFDCQSTNEIYACQRLPSGYTVIRNWLGHGQFSEAPHLLDAHALLWFVNEDAHLSRKAREVVDEDQNSVFVSLATNGNGVVSILLTMSRRTGWRTSHGLSH